MTLSTPARPTVSKSSKAPARLPTPSEQDEMSGGALLEGLKELEQEQADLEKERPRS